MKNVKLNKAQKRAAKDLLNRFLTVLLTFAMVLQSSPFAYAEMSEDNVDTVAVEATNEEPAAEPEATPEPEPVVVVEEEPAAPAEEQVVVEEPTMPSEPQQEETTVVEEEQEPTVVEDPIVEEEIGAHV